VGVGVALGNAVGATSEARTRDVAVSWGWIATPELLPKQAERASERMTSKKGKLIFWGIVTILYR
jgi:hypothetical protein